MLNSAGAPILVTGVANHASIAWSVVKFLQDQGRSVVLAVHPSNIKRVTKLLAREGMDAPMCELDVACDASMNKFDAWLSQDIERLGGFLHSIAYADVDALSGRTLDCSKASFLQAIEASSFSFIAMSKMVEPLMEPRRGIVALTYNGSRYCIPGYGVMGVAKSALESAVRYVAHELGEKDIMVNAVSAGPVLTMSSSAFSDIDHSLELSAKLSPLKRELDPSELAEKICTFILQSGGVTGQTIYVDNGLSIVRSV